jgi:hypothetical protein
MECAQALREENNGLNQKMQSIRSLAADVDS